VRECVARAVVREMSITASDWRPHEKTTLRGFLTLHLALSGLVLREVSLHQKRDRRWIGLPSKPLLDAEGCHRIDPATNKKPYVPIVEITGKEARERFEKAALAAVDKLLGGRP
jgi:hypothetical protein